MSVDGCDHPACVDCDFFRNAVPVGVWVWGVADCCPVACSFYSAQGRNAAFCTGVDYDRRGGSGAGLAEDSRTQRRLVGALFALWDSCGAVVADEHSSAGREDCARDLYHCFFDLFFGWSKAARIEER